MSELPPLRLAETNHSLGHILTGQPHSLHEHGICKIIKSLKMRKLKNLILLYWINEKSCAGLKNLQKPHTNVFTGFYLTKDFSITGQNLIPVSIKYASDCLNCNKKTYNQAAVAITVLKTIRSCANTLFQTLTVKIMNAFNNSKLLRHKKQFLKNIAVNCLCLH